MNEKIKYILQYTDIKLKEIIDIEYDNYELIDIFIKNRPSEMTDFIDSIENLDKIAKNLVKYTNIFSYLPKNVKTKSIIYEYIKKDIKNIKEIRFDNDLKFIYSCCILDVNYTYEIFKKQLKYDTLQDLSLKLLKSDYDIKVENPRTDVLIEMFKYDNNLKTERLNIREVALGAVRYNPFRLLETEFFDKDFIQEVKPYILDYIPKVNCSKIIKMYYPYDIDVINKHLLYDPYFIPLVNKKIRKKCNFNGRFLRYDWTENIYLLNKSIKIKRKYFRTNSLDFAYHNFVTLDIIEDKTDYIQEVAFISCIDNYQYMDENKRRDITKLQKIIKEKPELMEYCSALNDLKTFKILFNTTNKVNNHLWIKYFDIKVISSPDIIDQIVSNKNNIKLLTEYNDKNVFNFLLEDVVLDNKVILNYFIDYLETYKDMNLETAIKLITKFPNLYKYLNQNLKDNVIIICHTLSLDFSQLRNVSGEIREDKILLYLSINQPKYKYFYERLKT